MSENKPDDKPRPRMVKPPSEEAPARPRMVKPPTEEAAARPRMVKPPAEGGARTPSPRAAGSGRAGGGRRGRPAPAKAKSPVPLILGGAGLVAVIVIVVLVVSSGGRGGNSGGASGSETAATDASDSPAGGKGGPAAETGSAGNVEDQVDRVAERREEYRRRNALAESVDELFQLANWCKSNALAAEMRETAARILERKSDHAGAHRLLGHELFAGEHPDYQDKWLTKEQLVLAQKAEKEYQHRLSTDPKFEAMEMAIKNAKYQYLRDVPHFAVREWPFVLFVEDFGTEARNEYYGAEKADQVRAFWNYMEKTFPGLIQKDPEYPFKVIVFKDAASYNRFNSGQHAGSGSGGTTSRARAHFSLRTKFVYYYEKNAKGSSFDAETTLGVLFHECTHQLLNWLRPRQNEASPSMWFEEAFAEYIGAVKKTGVYEKDSNGVDRMTFHIARVNKYRLPHIRRMMKVKHIFTLPTMFQCRTYDEANSTFRIRFGKSGGHGQLLLYSQGWSFVHFCMNEPSGKYRDKMIEYIKKDAAGDSFGYETLCKCFGLGLQAKEWEPIEREWTAYVRRLQPDGTLKERKKP